MQRICGDCENFIESNETNGFEGFCRIPLVICNKKITFYTNKNHKTDCQHFSREEEIMVNRTKEQALDKVLDFIRTNWKGEDNFILSDDRVFKRIKVSVEECKNIVHLITDEYYINVPPKETIVSGNLAHTDIPIVGKSQEILNDKGELLVRYYTSLGNWMDCFVSDWKVYKEVKGNE